MSAHTPGPWFVGDVDHNGQRIVRQQHIEICTCWHHSVGSIEKEMEANARLIAAAPDLLEALTAITDQLERIGDTRRHKDGQFIDDARAAIAKATGAS